MITAIDEDIDLTAEITGNGADCHTDNQNYKTGEQTNGKGNSCAIDYADKVIAARIVGSEDMGHNEIPFGFKPFFALAVFKGLKVVIAGVAACEVVIVAQAFIIFIGPNGGNDDRGEGNNNDNKEAYNSDLILPKALDTIFKKGGGRAHLNHVFLLFAGSGEEIFNVNVHA